MPPPKDSRPHENGGFFSSYQLLTLYFPAFVFALGYSIATPAIPVLAKSFDTGFGVASLVIVVHALGGLLATVPTGFLVDRMGRRRFSSPGRCSWRRRLVSSPWRTRSASF